MKYIDATSSEQVRNWVETTPHHRAYWADSENKDPSECETFVLAGYQEKLCIPKEILAECSLKAGDIFDRRMYRWDYGQCLIEC